ncbi:endoglucanase [Marinimicrobium koreense]|uniref:Endoglucanase n=1 Tax=Marinimicrobium koreense TaxID=306545 RepID=A0A3N1NTP4_9GAMM|nr:cellulase family glycosylhydrolase [Marinimicrobium koreense]ROQ19565.1 endoglucanase [Marinimicrobium koreense]
MTFSKIKTISGAFLLAAGLMVAPITQAQSVQCDYLVQSDWGAGAIASIQITNNDTSAINGWQVSWEYEHSTITNLWNAELEGANPYSATNLSWNQSILPGQSIEFGFQVSQNGDAEVPELSGALCSGASSSSSSSVSSSSSSSQSSSSSSVISSSSSSSSVSSSASSSSSSSVSDPGGLTAVELTEQMGVGWNVGNSLDAIGGETAWGNPEITRELIDRVKAAGFDTLRVPVAWSQFSDAENFIIEESWKNRVEEVVNYALDADLYVIMNIHWDGGWMQPTYADQEYVNNRLAIMWTQIAEHFEAYDHRLLFAGTNEVMVEGDYGTPTEEYYTVQNSFNQTFVDTVRATGGNNADRYLVVQGFNTNIDHTVNFAEIPEDTVSDRLLMEVHYYDPYNFTLNESSNITQWGSIATDPNVTETWANESYVDNQFQRMQTNFVDQGVGVILGEYGVISRQNVEDHDTYRRYWNEYITQSALDHGMVPVYWDNGYAGNGGFALFDRYSGSVIEPELVEVLVEASD